MFNTVGICTQHCETNPGFIGVELHGSGAGEECKVLCRGSRGDQGGRKCGCKCRSASTLTHSWQGAWWGL